MHAVQRSARAEILWPGPARSLFGPARFQKFIFGPARYILGPARFQFRCNLSH